MSTFLERLGYIAQALVSVLVLAAFFGAIAAFFALNIRGVDLLPGLKEVLLVLIGVLAGSFKDVVGFWLGSSHGSTVKTEAMKQQQ